MDLIENKNKGYALFYLKQGILVFWFLWFSIAFLTNLSDFLIVTDKINNLAFRSDNYSSLAKVLNLYHMPKYFLNSLFSFDIFAQGLSAILFLIATISFWRRVYYWQTINIAFLISIALWAIFLVMEEIFIAYSFEPTHISLFVFEMMSLLTLHLLQD